MKCPSNLFTRKNVNLSARSTSGLAMLVGRTLDRGSFVMSMDFHPTHQVDVAMLMGYPSPYNNHGNQSPENSGFVLYQNQPIPSIIQGHGFQGVRPDPIPNVTRCRCFHVMWD
ncbi:hypothetical protein Nepgr_010220 [Nepenthes gracilis]|uniref:Uncharacterized protein n=1 Tax=Nepenthes gracilis TaxID=150966 RepID=A0AAD3SCL5_NEPGR|nr:hypothetical protein Nepgr_010220 [Nepenthes gracilis]